MDRLKEAIEQISNNRAEIIDNFCKFFMAQLSDKELNKLASGNFERLQLVENRVFTSLGTARYVYSIHMMNDDEFTKFLADRALHIRELQLLQDNNIDPLQTPTKEEDFNNLT
jgi:hypothetical protein